MRYYPVHLDLLGRPVLVVGGGTVAEGKILQLVDAGARVRVVASRVTAGVTHLAETGWIDLRRTEFAESDLADVVLVISATNSKETNEYVASQARSCGIWCNVVDDPGLCDFITPALVVRGELQIGISTGGGSPVLAQRVKREVAAVIGDEYRELLEIATQMRIDAKTSIPDFEQRRDRLRGFIESQALDLLRRGRRSDAVQLALKHLKGEHVDSGVSTLGT